MDIITMRLDDLKPYSNNTKEHPQEQIDEIKESIARYGMNDPIAIWGKSNVIVEGHGRFEALRQMGIKEAPCICFRCSTIQPRAGAEERTESR